VLGKLGVMATPCGPLTSGKQIIDPLRLTVFKPGHPQYLSAVAIKVLTEYHQHIKIIGTSSCCPSSA
jgi:hypothetical protein